MEALSTLNKIRYFSCVCVELSFLLEPIMLTFCFISFLTKKFDGSQYENIIGAEIKYSRMEKVRYNISTFFLSFWKYSCHQTSISSSLSPLFCSDKKAWIFSHINIRKSNSDEVSLIFSYTSYSYNILGSSEL